MGGPCIIDGQAVDETDNFLECKFEVDGKEWITTEGYFQAIKFIKSPDYLEKIRKEKDPMTAWSLGNYGGPKLRDDWEEVKVDMMYKANYAKFSQNQSFKEVLINSKGNIKAPPSTANGFWEKWNGLILERIREELRPEKQRDVTKLNKIINEMEKLHTKERTVDSSFDIGQDVYAQYSDGIEYKARVIRTTESGYLLHYYEFGEHEKYDQTKDTIRSHTISKKVLPLPGKLMQQRSREIVEKEKQHMAEKKASAIPIDEMTKNNVKNSEGFMSSLQKLKHHGYECKNENVKAILNVKVNGKYGIKIRKSPDFPGILTGVTTKGNIVLQCSEKALYPHEGKHITFYKLDDGRGWIHNWNPFTETFDGLFEIEKSEETPPTEDDGMKERNIKTTTTTTITTTTTTTTTKINQRKIL